MGMAADMQLARQELFNPKQFAQLQQQIDKAKEMAAYTMGGPVVTIDLTSRWKKLPELPKAPPKKSKPRTASKKECPGCGRLFQNLGMHSYTCKPVRRVQPGELCEFGCGLPALHITVKGKACCLPSAKNCTAVNAARVAARLRKT